MYSARMMMAAFGVLILGQSLPDTAWTVFVKPIMEMGALTGLLVALLYLLKFELPALRKERDSMRKDFAGTLDRITDRWDQWEQIRHDDHEAAMRADRERTAACTETRLTMEAAFSRDSERAHSDADRAHDDSVRGR